MKYLPTLTAIVILPYVEKAKPLQPHFHCYLVRHRDMKRYTLRSGRCFQMISMTIQMETSDNWRGPQERVRPTSLRATRAFSPCRMRLFALYHSPSLTPRG